MPANDASHSEDIERFRQFIESRMHVPQDEWDYLLPRLARREFEKNEYLVRAGDVAENFFFITSGLVRFFYSTENGREFNKHFAMEDGFAGSLYSMIMVEPCGFFIQAMEDTRTVVLPDRLLVHLYDRHQCWERFGRKIAEHLVFVKEARERELLLDSLEVRYRRFLKEFPGLADRMPQYHIASFLGVTDVALSRMRGKINRG